MLALIWYPSSMISVDASLRLVLTQKCNRNPVFTCYKPEKISQKVIIEISKSIHKVGATYVESVFSFNTNTTRSNQMDLLGKTNNLWTALPALSRYQTVAKPTPIS